MATAGDVVCAACDGLTFWGSEALLLVLFAAGAAVGEAGAICIAGEGAVFG